MAGLQNWNEWSTMFLIIGGAALAILVFIPVLKDRLPLPKSGAGGIGGVGSIGRNGLNELLENYQKARNKRNAMVLGPMLAIPGLYFARDADSFVLCMIVLIGGLLLLRRSFAPGRSFHVDYKKEAASLITGGVKNAAALFDKLDGEIRRGAAILKSENDYHLYPSALVADKGGASASPWIIPTELIKYMSYTARRGDSKPHYVVIYDEQKKAIALTKSSKQKEAEALMKELKARFGVKEPEK